MEAARARELLRAERARVEELLEQETTARGEDLQALERPGDTEDPAVAFTAEGIDDAVIRGLTDRLAAIGRAEQRLEAGTYGWSVRSGSAIPDERLEADPAAELTVEEAQRGS